MKYLIVGRTATGKDTLANILEYKYNWKFVKSYTTRPKRYDTEDTHVFISDEEATAITRDEEFVIAYTQINDYEYFATYEQFMDADAYIIDPHGVVFLLNTLRNKGFDDKIIIIYLRPENNSLQYNAFVDRESKLDRARGSKLFTDRDNSEDEQFTQFEDLLDNHSLNKDDYVFDVIQFVNNYNIDSMKYFAHSLETQRKLINSMSK